MEHLGTRFRRAVDSSVSSNRIPWVRFGKDDGKIDVMQPHIEAKAATGRSEVAAIGVSLKFQRVWSAYQWDTEAAEQLERGDPRFFMQGILWRHLPGLLPQESGTSAT